MSDDIRALTAQLAADPASLVFLPLGEALRRRGQLDSAQKKEKSSKNDSIEELFDGRKGKEIVAPVRQEQLIGIPELELEKEIGAY